MHDKITGKAISGGRPLTKDELDGLAKDQLAALRQAFTRHPALEKTDDAMDLRVAEELRLVERMLEMVEARVADPAAKKSLQQSEDMIEDLATIVEADDPCEALSRVDPDLGRRLTRRSLNGEAGPCDNRKPIDLRKLG